MKRGVRRYRLFGLGRGFTLIELMVALTMGLIVGIAVVALSRDVTNTFHEESRVTTTESSLRSAMDRLRADLERASMMSTPNALADTTATINVTGTQVFMSGMAGIRLYSGGSLATASSFLAGSGTLTPGPAISTPSGLTPDAIDITGNLAPNADFYAIQGMASGASICGGTRLYLAINDALYRAAGGDPSGDGGGQSSATLRRAFIPAGGGTGSQFLARIIDTNATPPIPQQYVIICDAGYDGTRAYVDLQSTSTVNLTGVGSSGMINPVWTARWRVATSSGDAGGVSVNPTGDTYKFDLIRTYVDATGAEVGTADNANGEIVAEYVVDLKFRLTVDTQTPNSTLGPQIVAYSFDDGGAGWGASLGGVTAANAKSQIYPTVPAPQRIRSVGVRLAGRTAIADRTVDLPSNVGNPWLYRYQVGDAGKYARVRTLTSEVYLYNQTTVFP